MNGFTGKVDVTAHLYTVDKHDVSVSATTTKEGSATALVLNDTRGLRKYGIDTTAGEVANLFGAKALGSFTLFDQGRLVLRDHIYGPEFHA